MFQYTNCPVCGKPFSQNDDIVVCPICGTPHHRHCYMQNGACYNAALHDSGFVFKETEESNDKAKEIVCPRCGTNNPNGSSFCLHCGMKLGESPFSPGPAQQNAGQQLPYSLPFFYQPPNIDMEEEIDGIKVKYLSYYIKSNVLYYISKFRNMVKSESKFSWNWGAFISPIIYYFYRKMWILGVVSFFVMLLNLIPSVITMMLESGLQLSGFPAFLLDQTTLGNLQNYSTVVAFAFYFLSGVFANYLYKRKTYKAVQNALLENQTNANAPDATIQKLSRMGGVSPVAVMTILAVFSTSLMIFTYFIIQ